MRFETVIGLELHVQLATASKIFSGASTAYGAAPNTQASAVDLGLPGVLPVLNGEAVRMAVLFGLAVDATIARHSVFARKNYFYPDLPKGYQISQYELPIVIGGHVDVDLDDGTSRHVRLTRAHLEEDAGKSLHEAFHGMSGIDLNRAGTPLIEIVSEPDMRSAAEAVAYMRKVHTLVRHLGICDGNMQEGSFRCDANVSLRPVGEERLGTRTELKNLNSFRFVERAIEHEVERHTELLAGGRQVHQETRLYDPQRDETRPMRSKEEANDYRYFPDPDLLPVEISEDYVEAVRATLPEAPDARRRRFTLDYGLGEQDAVQLTASRELADYFEAAVTAAGGEARLTANWLTGEVSAALNRADLEITDCPATPEALGGLVARIADGSLSGSLARQIFEKLWGGAELEQAIAETGEQLNDQGEIERLVDEVIARSPSQVEQFRAGKAKVIGYFVGQVMKDSRGKANPQQVNEILARKLGPCLTRLSGEQFC